MLAGDEKGGQVPAVEAIILSPVSTKTACVVPLAGSAVMAGFPSPADDYSEGPLELSSFLVRNPAATMLVRAKGESMRDAGIFDGALLVVDRSATARDGSIVIAVVDGDFTVKRLRVARGKPRLEAANPEYPNIEVSCDDMIWGVVIHSIHSF